MPIHIVERERKRIYNFFLNPTLPLGVTYQRGDNKDVCSPRLLKCQAERKINLTLLSEQKEKKTRFQSKKKIRNFF